MKEFLKSVHICQSYRKNKRGFFFSGTRCSIQKYLNHCCCLKSQHISDVGSRQNMTDMGIYGLQGPTCKCSQPCWISVAVGDDKKKGKGKNGTKSHRWVIFQLFGSRPIWTDSHENWHGYMSRWRNHSVQFLFQYFRGFRSIGVKISVFPQLQQCWR